MIEKQTVTLEEERKYIWRCPYCCGKNRVSYAARGSKTLKCHSCEKLFAVRGIRHWRDDED